MATEVLRAHSILPPPAPQRIRAAAHLRPGSKNAGATTRSPPARTSAPAAGRRHYSKKARPASEVYAGPAFSTSPEPSSLPLPHFPAKKAVAAALVDDDATRGLRRILRLDI